MKKASFILAFLMVVFIIACKKDDNSSGNGPNGTAVDCGTVKFSSTILPLISSKCATSGCHDATSTSGPGPLTNYAQIFASRVQIISSVNANRMPQTGGPLSSAQKLQLACWSDAGSPNN